LDIKAITGDLQETRCDIQGFLDEAVETSKRVNAIDAKLKVELRALKECADSMDVLRWVAG